MAGRGKWTTAWRLTETLHSKITDMNSNLSRTLCATWFIAAALAGPAHAADLLQIYRDALSNDAT